MNTIFVDRAIVLAVATQACGFPVIVGDEGLLESAIVRPMTSAFGADAYPTLWDKAAALMHSIARNHALVDGNKRAAWAAAWTFLGLNGIDLVPFDVDEAERLVLATANGELSWQEVAQRLRSLI